MSEQEKPLLVLGATGGQGGAVVDAVLSGRPRPVRALVRDTRSPSAARLHARGVQTVGGSFDDPESLTAAMRDVAGLFAVTTPFQRGGVDTEITQGLAILTAARMARVPHLVFSSVAGADQHTGVPHFESKAVIERALAGSDMPYTVLAPAYFFDNALGSAAEIRNGTLTLPLPPDRALQQLARPDLGRFAAHVLDDPSRYTGERIELAGDAPTPVQMAAALGEALHREVHHRQVDGPDAISDPDMHAMWRFLREHGYRVDVPVLHARHPDVIWTTFPTWADRTFGGQP